MSNFLFFLLGLMVGGLSGITLMCMCIISKKSDLELVSYEKNKTEEHKTNKWRRKIVKKKMFWFRNYWVRIF